jgi:hypothetical protein
MLAGGSFCLAIDICFFGIWMLAQIDPNAKSHLPNFSRCFCAGIWGGIYFTLRPLIPNDAPRISN